MLWFYLEDKEDVLKTVKQSSEIDSLLFCEVDKTWWLDVMDIVGGRVSEWLPHFWL